MTSNLFRIVANATSGCPLYATTADGAMGTNWTEDAAKAAVYDARFDNKEMKAKFWGFLLKVAGIEAVITAEPVR